MQYFHAQYSNHPADDGESEFFGLKAADASLAFHRTVPGYEATKLVDLKALAAHLGVKQLFVKDESTRFGLNSFKGLGGSRCVADVMSRQLGLDPEHPDFELLTRRSREAASPITFCTATDGNHGRGIAWSAKAMGQKCVVWLPAGSAPERVENIRALGAETHVSDLN